VLASLGPIGRRWSRVLEPTCGQGHFIAGLLAQKFPPQEIQAIEADGTATALGDSLQKILTDLRSEKVAALVLLTDGRSNAGVLQATDVAARYGKKSIPIFAIGVAAAEAAVGLALIISIYRHYKTTNLDQIDSMRG